MIEDAKQRSDRKRGPNYANISREITKGLDRVAIQLLKEALSDDLKDPLPLPQRLDVFTSVAKYLAIKNKSTDDDSKGEGLDVYAERLKQDEGSRGETSRGGTPESRISPFARTTSPDANGGSLLAGLKSRLPTAGNGAA